jgi:hypothetical protein
MKHDIEIKPAEKSHKKDKYRHQFDFEVGTFRRSPCKTCLTESNFPNCMDTCGLLSRIHTLLKNVISCSLNRG